MHTIETKITISAITTCARRRSVEPSAKGASTAPTAEHDRRDRGRRRPAAVDRGRRRPGRPNRLTRSRRLRRGGGMRPARRTARCSTGSCTIAWYVSAAPPCAPKGSNTSSRLRPRPITRKPNRIALGTLVSRATTATENVSMPKKMILVGSSVPCGDDQTGDRGERAADGPRHLRHAVGVDGGQLGELAPVDDGADRSCRETCA